MSRHRLTYFDNAFPDDAEQPGDGGHGHRRHRCDHPRDRLLRLLRPVRLLSVAAGAVALVLVSGAVSGMLAPGNPEGASRAEPGPISPMTTPVGALVDPSPGPRPSGRPVLNPVPSPRPGPEPKRTSAGGRGAQPTPPVSSPAAAGPVMLSLDAALDNIGVASDSDPTAGNLDGSGSAFSAQALAADGARPGAVITSDGVTFTWPDAAAAAPDNVTASGQALPASGSGNTLSFLVTAGWGPATGTGTVVYADGSTQGFTIAAPDWWRGCSSPTAPGVALYTPYRDQGNGRAPFTVCIYSASVPLRAGKEVDRIVLPDISDPVPRPGEASLHIFAATIH